MCTVSTIILLLAAITTLRENPLVGRFPLLHNHEVKWLFCEQHNIQLTCLTLLSAIDESLVQKETGEEVRVGLNRSHVLASPPWLIHYMSIVDDEE